MKKSYHLLLTLGIATASLSSCSRSNYAFNPNTPSYLGSASVRSSVAVAATEPVLTASTEATAPVSLVSPARAAARPVAVTVAHRAVRPGVVAAAAPSAEHTTFTKVERKELKQVLRQAIKQQKAATPTGTSAEGKSQLVAALLCFFLGGLGIHDFYLGYVGKGILQIFLSIIVIGFILVIIDFIRILTGSIKPKGGDYAKKI